MPVVATLLPWFNEWTPGYGGDVLAYYNAGTSVLATLFYDESGTLPAPNPLTLETWTDDCGCEYGKLNRAVYSSADAVEGFVSDRSLGIHRPNPPLDGKDASLTTIFLEGATAARPLNQVIPRFWVNAMGTLSPTDAAANTALIQSVLGIVGGMGGGEAVLPAGAYPFVNLSLPANTYLSGAGRDATTITSVLAASVISAAGSYCGLRNLTLDGASLQPNSIGFDAVTFDHLTHTNAKILRFDTGCSYIGRKFIEHVNVDLDNCTTHIKWYSLLAAGSNPESSSRHLTMRGGSMKRAVLYGLEARDVGPGVAGIRIEGMDISENLADAIYLSAVQQFSQSHNDYRQNLRHMKIKDNIETDPDLKSINIRSDNCSFVQGEISAEGTCQDVLFTACTFETHVWNLISNLNALLLEGCLETTSVSVVGFTTGIQRERIFDQGGTQVETNDNANHVIWSCYIAPGQAAIATARVIAIGVDNVNGGAWVINARIKRPGSTLGFDNQTTNFVLGAKITGQTSGATGYLVAQSDSGTSGTLTLRRITGVFADNEIITGSGGGSALVNGVLAPQAVTIIDQVADYSNLTAGLAAAFSVTANELQVFVNGITNDVFEWSAEVVVVLTT